MGGCGSLVVRLGGGLGQGQLLSPGRLKPPLRRLHLPGELGHPLAHLHRGIHLSQPGFIPGRPQLPQFPGEFRLRLVQVALGGGIIVEGRGQVRPLAGQGLDGILAGQDRLIRGEPAQVLLKASDLPLSLLPALAIGVQLCMDALQAL